MRITQEIIAEAKFWLASGIESYADIKIILELGEDPISEMQWDAVLAAFDEETLKEQIPSAPRVLKRLHTFDWDNYVYDNTVGLDEDGDYDNE